MRNICIIPARGGSKRIPHKNIRSFLGKPIIAYSIEAAINSRCFDEVMVSTDDEEIARIAVQYGAKVPFMRSDNTANDYATLSDVVKEVLDKYSSQGIHFDYMCCILATSPLLRSEDILSGYNKLRHSDFSSIVPVVQFSYPIQRSFKIDESGELSYIWPEYSKSRSQDLTPSYHDAGSFYWHVVSKWLSGDIHRGAIVVDESTVQDIDTEQDWNLAELKYKLLFK